LTFFLSDPVGRGPTGMLKHEYVAHFHHQLLTRDIGRKLAELAKEAETVAELEKRIAEF
jgi:hypothetical protein